MIDIDYRMRTRSRIMSPIFLASTLKPVFHERIFSREATFFFCLNLISSTWFQPKAQGQREKVASRENIR